MTDTVPTSAKSPKSQQIVETAYRLFRENGFYATGVDLIMREAGVSKRTLYQYFPSKNDLIVAVLIHYQEQCQQHLETVLDRHTRPARDNLLAIFEDANSWFGDANFHGCLAVNAMGEFGGKDTAIEQACLRFKQWEIGLLQELTMEVDADQGEIMAHQLFVLLEGMVSIAHVMKDVKHFNVMRMAKAVLDSRGL